MFYVQFVFIVCQVEDYQNILKLSCRPLAFTSNKTFLKNKERSRTSLLASFSERFLKEKYFYYYILVPGQISLSTCLYFKNYWARYWTIYAL